MTLEEARRYLEANGYVVTELKTGSFQVLESATKTAKIGTAADIIAMAGEIQGAALTPPWWNPAWGALPTTEDKYGDPVIDWDTAIKIADKLGAFGEQLPYFASYTEAQREAARRTAATATKAAGGVGTPAFTFEAVPLNTGGYTVRVKVAGPPSGAMSQEEAEAEAARLGERYEAVRDPATGLWYVDLKEEKGTQGQVFDTYADALEAAPEGFQPVQRSDGKWVFERVEAGKPTEQYLGTVEEGGWQIDQYGYMGADGKPVIIARQPRQPIKDPILSLDEMMAQALAGVDFNDPTWKTSQDYLRAQAIKGFKEQPTSQERLQMALQIAQSPSDYLTLVALYTGAIQRESPARVGERIAPLAPILQMMAQQFFLDIPGINHVPTQEETAAGGGLRRKPDEDGATGAGGGAATTTGTDWIETANGRRYNPATGTWEPWDDFVARTGYQDSTLTPPLPGQGEPGPGAPPGYHWVITDEGEELVPDEGEVATATTGPQPFGPQTMQTVSQGAQAQQTAQQPTKMLSLQEQVQQAQGTQLPSNVAQTVGATKVGELDTSHKILGQLGKIMETLATGDEEAEKKKALPVPKFQSGGVVPGYLGQPQLAQVEGGETVLTPEQIQALLQQSGMFGPVYRPDLQQLPQFLAQPRRVSLAELTGGALRPRSLQTIRRQSPTQRMLTVEMAKGFGVPAEDFLEEEAMATSIGGPRRMARFTGTRVRTGA